MMHSQVQAGTTLPLSQPKRPWWLLAGFWICTIIAVAVVIRRVLALAYPSSSGPPQQAELDAFFASHAALTLVHILPALAFVVIAPFVVFRKSARVSWAQQLLFPLGAIVGFTAYAMSIDSVGGWLERSAVLFFNSLFLWSLFRSFRFYKSGEEVLERRWMMRAIAILLGIATTRPVMGVFFATSPATHLVPSQFFGVAFWIGFSINALIGEYWLRRRSGTRFTAR